MLWTYVMKGISEQLNEINVYDYVITPMENFTGTTTDINLKKTTHGSVQFMSSIKD